MHGTKELEQKILHRLKIARGHLDKVIKMVETKEYCVAVIHQNQAVQSALKQIDNILLENHLKTCVVNQLKNGDTEKSIQEIMKVFERKRGKK